jgi:RNA polymerase-binding transcription factor DksA
MDQQQARTRLEEERGRLNRVLDGLRADPETESDAVAVGELSTYDQHPGEVGTEVFEHEKNQSLLEQVQAELAEVEEAFRRLEAGTYGVCQACRRPIAPERLEAMPATRFCVEDQAKAERDLGLPGVRT